MGGVEGARWQSIEQLHLTLRFIGETDIHTAREIIHRLSTLLMAPFALTIDGVSIFGTLAAPRILYAKVKPNAELKHLQQRIDQQMISLGLGPDKRKFTPHITLARFKKGRRVGRLDDYISAHSDLYIPSVSFEYFTLFQSRLGGEGASYQAVERFGLGALVGNN